MKFEPWDEFAKEFVPEILDIKEPPCKYCLKWKPQRVYSGLENKYVGVRLCWVAEMHTDFSCYEEKD